MDRLCRNCGSSSVATSQSGFVGPFFAERVLGVDTETLGAQLNRRVDSTTSVAKRTAGKAVHSFLAKSVRGRALLARRPPLRMKLRVCNVCGFVGPERVFTSEDLSSLYIDYRSETYNQDRVSAEPSYAAIMAHVGKDEAEVAVRLANVDELIRVFVDLDAIETVLDWGGGEARFIPSALRDRRVFVVDVSDEPLSDARYRRTDPEVPGVVADYAQVCHLLEHVSEPRALLRQVLTHVQPGGIVYVEVPEDQAPDAVLGIAAGDAKYGHWVGEHLNLFTVDSVRALGQSLSLIELSITVASMDFGWSKQNVISGLFGVPPSR